MGNCQRQPPRRQCRGQLDPTGGEAAATAHKAHDCDPAEKNPFSHFWQTKDFKPPDLDKDTHGCYCRASPHGGAFATTLKQFPPSLYWLGLQ